MTAAAPLVLIGCSATKADTPQPARTLYRGALFQKAVRWAESRGSERRVLSAAHGVVLPDTVLAPYDLTSSPP